MSLPRSTSALTRRTGLSLSTSSAPCATIGAGSRCRVQPRSSSARCGAWSRPSGPPAPMTTTEKSQSVWRRQLPQPALRSAGRMADSGSLSGLG
eukprot:4790255-Lingulodinium_polyedra.AAC.1